MEKLDKNMQRRVWDRVYGLQPSLTRQQRESLQRSLQRAEHNRMLFEKMVAHERYGEAFGRMSRETAEHCKMLRQMLSGK